MNLPKLLSLLPKHPKKAYEDAWENKPWGYGMYLACEVYDGNEKTYRLIFLDNVEQLIDFFPALLLSKLAVFDEDSHLDSLDYQEVFTTFKKYKNLSKFTEDLFEELSGDWGFINVQFIGFISTFFSLSSYCVEHLKNNWKIDEYEEFQHLGLNMSEYYIVSGFVERFDALPSELPAEFLTYISSLNNL
jgi:hypothetical protein